LIRGVLLGPTTTTAFFYGFMGLGFSGAHLLLAKFLPALEYAEIALVVAIVNVTKEFAPLGVQGVILRHRSTADRRTLARVAAACSSTGLLVAVGAVAVYGLGSITAALLAVAVLASGLVNVGAVFFQSRQAFIRAMLLTQISNLVLLAAAGVVILVPAAGARFALSIIVVGYVVVAVWSWIRLLVDAPHDAGRGDPFPWREALSYMVVSGAVPMLVQAERLFIPKLLSLEDLATFGVLAAIVLSPFKTLQVGATFTMLPRFRAAETVRARRRLLVRESLMLGVLVGVGSLILAWLTPWVVHVVFEDKYVLSAGLIWAALLVGALRTFGGVAKALAMALCTTRELALVGVLVWLAVGVAVVGSAIGAAWGMTGVVLGIAAGWVTVTAAYAVPALRHIRETPAASPARG